MLSSCVRVLGVQFSVWNCPAVMQPVYDPCVRHSGTSPTDKYLIEDGHSPWTANFPREGLGLLR